jgi:hypothetical protein
MSHTTRYGNTYTDREWKEVQEGYRREGQKAEEYFVIRDKSIEKAAEVLHNEFPGTPQASWQAAIFEQYRFDREPREIKFTSPQKATRFAAATKWIDSEIDSALAKI